MERILIILIILIILPISAYTGWYFGKIDGYEKARKETNESINYNNNNNYNKKRTTIPNQSKYKAKTTPNQFNYKKSQKTVKQSLKEMNEIVEETKRLNNRQVKSSSKGIEEKGVECRWTAGRIEELTRIIKTGGKGKESLFCGEYSRRIGELYRLNCQTRVLETIC